MIVVLTKTIHVDEIAKFFKRHNIECKIFTRFNLPEKLPDYDVGISYSWSRLVPESELKKAMWFNYHPSILPKYAGGDPYQQMFENKETRCGNTVHVMTKKYDAGRIIDQNLYRLNHPPISRDEIGAIAHYEMFKFFKETILDVIKIGESVIVYNGD